MTIGEWLKDARGDIPQDEIALRAGVSKSYIGLIENNKKAPSIKVAIRLAQAVSKEPTEALKVLAGEVLAHVYKGITAQKPVAVKPRVTPAQFAEEMRSYGISNSKLTKWGKMLTVSEMDEIITVAQSMAKTAAETLIEQKVSRKGTRRLPTAIVEGNSVASEADNKKKDKEEQESPKRKRK